MKHKRMYLESIMYTMALTGKAALNKRAALIKAGHDKTTEERATLKALANYINMTGLVLARMDFLR